MAKVILKDLKKVYPNTEKKKKVKKGEEPELDPGLISRVMSLMKRKGVKSDERALLEAMKPFLSERRREKMDKAIKLARLASLAGIAASELGLGEGDGDV